MHGPSAKARPPKHRAVMATAEPAYSRAFSRDLLRGSTQFVIPPVVSTKRVIGNCGAHSTSVPLKLPVTVVPKKTAKEPSSRCIPLPPLAVIVIPPNDACAPPRSTTPYPQKGVDEVQTLPLMVPPLSRSVEFRNPSTPTLLLRKLELEAPK